MTANKLYLLIFTIVLIFSFCFFIYTQYTYYKEYKQNNELDENKKIEMIIDSVIIGISDAFLLFVSIYCIINLIIY